MNYPGLKSPFLFSLFLVLVLAACKKKETFQNDTETQSLIDNALVEQELMAIIPAAVQYLQIAEQNTGKSEIISACYTISLLSGDTIDFDPNAVYQIVINNTSCSQTDTDQKVRSGQLWLRTNGKMNQATTQFVIKLSNYVANGLDYNCDSILVNLRSVTDSTIKLSANIIGAKCSGQNFTVLYEGSTNIQLSKTMSGSNVQWLSHMSGKAFATNRFGIDFETNSDSLNTIVLSTNCNYFTKGIQKITNKGQSSWLVDYGNGSCDDMASYNIFENTVEFKLK